MDNMVNRRNKFHISAYLAYQAANLWNALSGHSYRSAESYNAFKNDRNDIDIDNILGVL